MGKWDAYVVCKNPACRPNGKWGPLSFRRVARGPVSCKFCGTDFELPACTDGWSTRDSKGRERPAPRQGNGEAKIDDVIIMDYLRKKCGDDPQKLEMVNNTMTAVSPPKVLSADEKLREAFRTVERTNADVNRLNTMCGEMEAACARRAREFMDYQAKLADAQNNLALAKDAVKEAKRNLLELQAADNAHQSQVSVQAAGSQPISSTQLAQGLGKLEVLQGMDAGQAKQLYEALRDLVNQIVAGSSLPPPSHPPPAATDSIPSARIQASPTAAVVPVIGAAGEMVGMRMSTAEPQIDVADDDALLTASLDDDMQARDSVKRDNGDEVLEGEKQTRRRLAAKTAADGTQPTNQQLIAQAKIDASKLLEARTHVDPSTSASASSGVTSLG